MTDDLATAHAAPPDFGDRVLFEMKRYGVPNELYSHKVIGRFLSNRWVDVPVQSPTTETNHAGVEDVVSVICEGVEEIDVFRFRVADIHAVIGATARAEIAALRAQVARYEGVWADLPQSVFQDECDAHAAAMAWFESLFEAVRENADDIQMLEFDQPKVGNDGRVLVLYHKTKHIAVATIFRDQMNWSRLAVWCSDDPILARAALSAKAG